MVVVEVARDRTVAVVIVVVVAAVVARDRPYPPRRTCRAQCVRVCVSRGELAGNSYFSTGRIGTASKAGRDW